MTLACVLPAVGCGGPLSQIPELVQGAHSTGGENYLCGPYPRGVKYGDISTTPETASHSPEINSRLHERFPPGSPSAALRRLLVEEGFQLRGACPPDGRTQFASYAQSGGSGLDQRIFATVYWKTDSHDKLVWSSGNIENTFF
jgi:hypothetical protein